MSGDRKPEDRGRLPRISVVTPSLNQGAFIEGNIHSVLDQGYPDFEHIVVDGVSTDETLDILRRHRHIRWVSEKDRNMTEALNKGFRMATGEIIAWLNTDDRYLPRAFETVGRHLGPGSPHQVVVGDVRKDDRIRGEVYERRGAVLSHRQLVRFWGQPYRLYQPAIFFRRRLLEEAGYLDESLDYVMDYEFWLRLARRVDFHHVDAVLAEVIYHPDCKTADLGPNHAERLEVSKRYWGRPGSVRWYGHWSSHEAAAAVQAAYRAHLGGRRGRGLASLGRALLVRPAVLASATWWSVLGRLLVGSPAVDAVRDRLRPEEEGP